MKTVFSLLKTLKMLLKCDKRRNHNVMGLDQLQVALLVPDDSLLRLFATQGKVFVMQHETFFIWDY